MKKLLLILLFLPMIGLGQTISFSLDVNSGITGLGNNAQIATSDVDNDGDIDVLITADSLSELFYNNGSGSFNMSGANGMFPQTEYWNGTIDFSDIDNDGHQDVLFTGNKDANNNLKSEIYRNDGTSYFVLVNGTSFEGVNNSSVEFADIDNDGDEDLLITGDVGANDFIGLYKNDGAGNFIEDTIFPASCGVIEGDVGFLDFDGDADLDLIITGFTYDCDDLNAGNIYGAITILYENDGTGNFTPASNQPFWGAESSSISFGDIDGDNDMDIIVSGWDGAGSSFTNLGVNDGVGNFTLVNGGGGIVEVRNSSVAFSDLDNDSDLDLIISGEDNMGQNQTVVYSNDGVGNFTEVQNLNLVAPANPIFVCVDIDGDTDLDLIIVGDNSTSVYINDSGFYGCTDSLACNYDPLATIEDSSCVYPSIDTVTVIAVESYVWAVDGVTYTTSGTYIYVSTNVAGCDSIIYLDLTTLPSPENLFFSEYAEGSSSNRYLEIYNTTNDTIDLTNYALGRVSGNPDNVGIYEDWVDFDSAAVVLPNDVYIVAHSSADALILAEVDMIYNSLSTGDDGFALLYGNNPGIPISPFNGNYQILDWIGDWMGDPGQGWEVAGVNNATRNHTLVRKCAINQGDTSWTNAAGTDPVNSQWIVLAQDDWTSIGFHNICICDSSTNSYTTITDTLCNGLSIVVGNNTYDSTGVYSDTLLAFNGCDSIITTNLTVLNSSISNVTNNMIICDGDSIIVGSNIYNTTGSYTDTLLNAAGCDSIVSTYLTVQVPTYQDITICDGDSILVGNSVYNSSGSYTDTIVSSIGCDSIVYTNLTIYSQFLISGGIPNNTVGGGSYYSGSQYLELSCYVASELVSAVIYSDDTTLTTFEIRDDNGNVLDDTTVNIIPGGHRIYFNYNMSAGVDYELGVNGSSDGLFRNNSGVNYPYNFANAAAVTSSSAGGNYYYFFYDIQLHALSTAAFTTDYAFCDGDSILVGSSIYDTTGLYTDTLISSLGCDSLIYSNVIVSPHLSYINNQTICNGESYLINGNIYDSTGTYIDSLTSLAGCDSIVTTNLYVDSIVGGVGINNHTICLGDSIMVGSSIYYDEGVYNDTLISSNGCDSIVTTTLSVITANYVTLSGGVLDTSVTAGEYSNYDGYLILDVGILSLLKSATVYAQDTNTVTFELRDDNGGVLEAVTHTVYPGEQSLIFNFIMQAGTDYQLGIDGGNSGLYRNNAGTGSALAYPFDIGPVSITSSNAGDQYYYFYYDIEMMPYATYMSSNICDGDSIVVGTNVYHATGNYTDIFNASNSCDSIVYTNLLIDYPTYSFDTITSSNVILWNTMYLGASGDYSDTLINVNGCDSIAYLNLTITNTTGVIDLTNKKQLVKITDLLGKEVPYRHNRSLFYIYDDGTIEKRIVID